MKLSGLATRAGPVLHVPEAVTNRVLKNERI